MVQNTGDLRLVWCNSLDQMVSRATQQAKQTIIQDMQILKKSQNLMSSVSAVECYVCGKGLQDGHSITAKTLSNGIVLFCDVHYSLQ